MKASKRDLNVWLLNTDAVGMQGAGGAMPSLHDCWSLGARAEGRVVACFAAASSAPAWRPPPCWGPTPGAEAGQRRVEEAGA